MYGKDVKAIKNMSAAKVPKKKWTSFLAAFAVMICLNTKPAYAAGAIEEIVTSMVSSLFESFSKLLLSLCDFVIGPIFSITTMTVDQIAAYIPGFNTGSGSGAYFSKAITIISVCIACVLAISSVIRLICGLAMEDKVESPVKLVWRTCITIPLVMNGQRLLSMAFDYVVSPIAQVFAGGASAFENTSVFQDMAAPLTSDSGTLTTLLVGTVLMVMIASSLIQLILEAAERYLMCIFLIFLSPLGFSFGVTEPTAQVAKNWFKMFCSHCILLVLNIWVIGIARTCFDTIDSTATPQQILVWGIITYGYIKIAQKLDDILQNSGLLLTRTGGDFLQDMIAAGAVIGKAISFGTDTAALAGGAIYSKVTGGNTGEFLAEQIPRYASKHPVAGVAAGVGAAAGAGVMAGAKGIASLADVKTATKVLSGTNESRKNLQTSNNPVDFNSVAYHKAAEGKLKENGFAGDAFKNGAKVESLRMNNDGSMTGMLVRRNAEGNIMQATMFSMSDSEKQTGGIKVASQSSVAISNDEQSAVITTEGKGSFALRKAGVDARGIPVWETKQITTAGGSDISDMIPGLDTSAKFSFKPDSKNPDGEIAQASAFVQENGKLDEVSKAAGESLQGYSQTKQVLAMSGEERRHAAQASLFALNNPGAYIAAEEKLRENNVAADALVNGGKVEQLDMNQDGLITGSIVQRNPDGVAVGQTEFSFNSESAVPVVDRSAQYGQDGKSVMIDDAKYGRFELKAVGTDKFNNQVWEASRVQDAGGNQIAERLGLDDSPSKRFSFRADMHSNASVAEQAAVHFTNEKQAEAIAQETDHSMQAYEQLQQETNAAGEMFHMTDDQRVERLRGDSQVVNYSDDAHLQSMTNFIRANQGGEVDDNIAQMVQEGGEVVSMSAMEDGRLVGLIERRDDTGNLVEEAVFSVSTSSLNPDTSSGSMFGGEEKEIEPSETMAEVSPLIETEKPEAVSATTAVDAPMKEHRMPPESGMYTAQSTPPPERDDSWSPFIDYPEQQSEHHEIPQPVSATASHASTEPGNEQYSEQSDSIPMTEVQNVQAEPLNTRCEEIHHVKYEQKDDSAGIVETPDLGRVQLTRTRVDKDSGESVWQVVQKRSPHDEYPDSAYFAEITRKGNHGVAEDFMSFARDISRRAQSFDQIGVLDVRADQFDRKTKKNSNKNR